ncbi:MAG: PadR family transcriptional regulator [Gemmatimonadota bacterium]
MHQAELVVLGLLGRDARHGYEIARELEAANLRQWAQIGPSTVYRVLRRLERQGHVTHRLERQGERPAKKVYSLTDSGLRELSRRVRAALFSERPVYCDRLVGAVFARIGLEEEWPDALEQARERLDGRRATLRAALDAGTSPQGKLILSFYLNVADAERTFLLKAANLFERERLPGPDRAPGAPAALPRLPGSVGGG